MCMGRHAGCLEPTPTPRQEKCRGWIDLQIRLCYLALAAGSWRRVVAQCDTNVIFRPCSPAIHRKATKFALCLVCAALSEPSGARERWDPLVRRALPIPTPVYREWVVPMGPYTVVAHPTVAISVSVNQTLPSVAECAVWRKPLA